MNDQPDSLLPRILIIDDNESIHSDFRKILGGQGAGGGRLQDLENALFGSTEKPVDRPGFRIDSAFQGQEGLALVQRALDENDPYAMAFVDVRMPPGWDGVETLERIWQCYPEMQAVICTAYSDYSWDDMGRRLGLVDRLLILKKPFDTTEVLQLAYALTAKWALARQAKLRMEDLDRMVRERTEKLQREIQERKCVEEVLRISEERFAKAFRASPMAMAIQDRAGRRFLDANPSFLDLTGYDAGQLLQRTAEELRLWENEGPLSADTLKAGDGVHSRPFLLRRGDGMTRNTLVWVEPITLVTGPSLLLIAEDITQRLKLEGQLRQAHKMEAVGCLTAGIAHEFNNILTVIQGHACLLRGNQGDRQTAAESVERIVQASQRAAALTRRLLTFSRKQPLQLKPLSLSTAINDLQKMLGRLLGEHYELQLDCAADLPLTCADEANMEQIVINLALNARDAMPAGGVIRISTSYVRVNERAAREVLDARPGRFVCLTVSDTGCGMSREVLSHIFDPFYTTKEVGKGTGLGLSTVHGIVQQHQGWIEVSSEVGRGSAFKVFLPACDKETVAGVVAEEPFGPMLRSSFGEAILVVEDEEIVREMARVTLERAGYRVFEAADGPKAVALWKECHTHIDLLVTDMVMPNGMSGGDLARTLQAWDPRLRVVYVSGYSSEVLKGDVGLQRQVEFLRKPYDAHALLKVIKLSLDNPMGGHISAAPLSADSVVSGDKRQPPLSAILAKSARLGEGSTEKRLS